MSLCAVVALGIVIALSVNFWMFTILRIFSGVFTVGIIQSSFILANELIGPSKRAISGNIIWIWYSIGYMLLALIAFYVRNWRHLQLTTSALSAVLIFTYVFVQESPRWLLSQGRVREATSVMRKLAKVNGAEIKLDTFTMNDVESDSDKDASNQGVIELLRRPRLRLYTLNLMFQLCVNTMVYYGVTMSAGSLGVNKYIAFAIAGAVEIPAAFVVVRPIERWGRRAVFIFFMVLSGVTMLSTIFIPLGIGRVTVAMVGKFAITASFCIVYLQTCEIIPTPVRNSALGMCSMCSNTANIFTPPILLLSEIWGPLPLVIFGSLAIIGAALSYLLPETTGKKIPETMEEGENIGWKMTPRAKERNLKDSKYSEIATHKAGVEMGDPV